MGLIAAAMRLKHQLAPATPSAGSTALYAKSDNLLYSKGADGVERLVVPGTDSRLSDARTPTSHAHSANDLTSGSVDIERLTPDVNNNYIRGNLGLPTLWEAAIFEAELENKFKFRPPASMEESADDGVTWTPHATAVTSSTVRNLFLGRGVSNLTFAYGKRLRMTWETWGYLNISHFYMYWSGNGHTCKIVIEVSDDAVTWTTLVDTNSIGAWPGHAYISHSPIWLNTNAANVTQYKYIRVNWVPTWNVTYEPPSPYANIAIYRIEWWGGYPAGNDRALYTWDADKNAAFPADLSASTFRSSATGQVVVFNNDARLSDARTPTTHTHVATTDLTATGTKSSATYLRGDNTWATPPDTTYTAQSQAEAESSTDTNARLTTGQRLYQAVIKHARPISWVPSWTDVTSKPTTFTPATHSHALADLPVASSGTSNATQLVRADDSRLSNARTPSGTAGGALAGSYPNPTLATQATVDFSHQTAPATPAADTGRVYVKANNGLYLKGSDGVEREFLPTTASALHDNPGFELVDANSAPLSWAYWADASVGITTDTTPANVVTGSRSLKITCPATQGPSAQSTLFSIPAGSMVKVTVRIKCSDAGGRASLVWYSADSGSPTYFTSEPNQSSYETSPFVVGTNYVEISQIFGSRSTNVVGRFLVRLTGHDSAARTYWIDTTQTELAGTSTVPTSSSVSNLLIDPINEPAWWTGDALFNREGRSCHLWFNITSQGHAGGVGALQLPAGSYPPQTLYFASLDFASGAFVQTFLESSSGQLKHVYGRTAGQSTLGSISWMVP